MTWAQYSTSFSQGWVGGVCDFICSWAGCFLASPLSSSSPPPSSSTVTPESQSRCHINHSEQCIFNGLCIIKQGLDGLKRQATMCYCSSSTVCDPMQACQETETRHIYPLESWILSFKMPDPFLWCLWKCESELYFIRFVFSCVKLLIWHDHGLTAPHTRHTFHRSVYTYTDTMFILSTCLLLK